MSFKVKSTEVTISFSFFAALLLFISVDKAEIYLLSLFASLLHETIHILFIKLFGGNVKSIAFNLFGGEIKRDISQFSPVREAVINIAAPVTNIVIGAVLLYFYGENCLFGTINLFLGIFNILPFHSFDGGRALFEILLIYFRESIAKNVITLLSVAVTVIFSFVSVYVFFNYNRNFMLCLMSVFLIVSVISDVFKTKKTRCKDL